MFLNNNLRDIAHVGIPVFDMEKTSTWYKTVLGFEEKNCAEIPFNNDLIKIKFLVRDKLTIELFHVPGLLKLDQPRNQFELIDRLIISTNDTTEITFKQVVNNIINDSDLGEESIDLISPNGEKVTVLQGINEQITGNIGSGIMQYTQDINRARTFYQNFGMNEIIQRHSRKGMVQLNLGEFYLTLFELQNTDQKYSRGRIDHFAFTVKDINLAYRELESSGFVMLDDKPVFQPNIWGRGGYYFIIEGPDGEGVEFNSINS